MQEGCKLVQNCDTKIIVFPEKVAENMFVQFVGRCEELGNLQCVFRDDFVLNEKCDSVLGLSVELDNALIQNHNLHDVAII